MHIKNISSLEIAFGTVYPIAIILTFEHTVGGFLRYSNSNSYLLYIFYTVARTQFQNLAIEQFYPVIHYKVSGSGSVSVQKRGYKSCDPVPVKF